MEKPLLSIITCFYNEEETIADYFARINQVLAAQVDVDVELVCVNDGSQDGTLQKLLAAAEGDRRINVLDLARNFGKEAAMTAGLDNAIGDVVVILDADLQDPPELLGDMLRLWHEGYEVVLGRRIDRMSDSFLKRATARWFYRLHNMLAEIPLPHDVGDFRLMDRQVVLALRQLPERQRFMKGIFAWLGFKQAMVDYIRPPRLTGAI